MTRAYWLSQLGGWSVYATTTVFQGLAVSLPVSRAIVEPLIAASIGIALTHGVRTIAVRRAWVQRASVALVWRAAATSIALACVHVALLGVVEFGIYGDRPASPVLVLLLAAMRWSLVFAVWLGLYLGYALIRLRQADELHRVALEHALQAAKLRALEAALNPHFLFNALNTVRALVALDTARADAAILQLGRLLRYALAAGQVELVTVARELEIVDDYLAIELLRLDARLRVERDVAAEAGQARIPAMLIQTLVENAIKHGIARLPQGGTLRIAARITARTLVIEVTNPRAPATTRSEPPGIGLANAIERVRLLCGDTASLQLELTDHLAIARLAIPQAAS